MPRPNQFTRAVLECLIQNDSALLEPRRDQLHALVVRYLGDYTEGEENALPEHPSDDQLQRELATLRTVLPNTLDGVGLVLGGATKIKGYVFEAPKLPEIRGASALLDWVNDEGLRALWGEHLKNVFDDAELPNQCVIYASGGGFLAFAPRAQAQGLAVAIERCYAEHTLTATSVAVADAFSLLELRFGRLCYSAEGGQIVSWLTQFTEHWGNDRLRPQLASYYYGEDDDELAKRFFRRKTFGELVTLLSNTASRRRDERAAHGAVRSAPLFQQLPLAQPCQTSGVRPAALVANKLPDKPALSQTAARKAYVGRMMKRPQDRYDWYERVFGKDVPKPTAWETHFLKAIAGKPYADAMANVNVAPAQDVGEIGQASQPRGYIGLIYADGNNVGRRVAKLTTPAEYQRLSQQLDDASRNAVFAALAAHLRPTRIRNEQGKEEFVHPFEIITIGGDDLLLIVPGSKALEIALAIGYGFEYQLRATSGSVPPAPSDRYKMRGTVGRYDFDGYAPDIGLSAGVVIAQENAPIFFLRDLVDDLLKSAKGLAKDNVKRGYGGGAIDFMVLKSVTMITDKIKGFRRQALGDSGEENARRLTARPYTWHELAGLLATLRAIKRARVPRSQLYQLRRALDATGGADITASVVEYLYTRVRLAPAFADALGYHVEENWCWNTPVPKRNGGLPPWMPLDKQGWETIWPDLLEAYEMVAQEAPHSEIEAAQ